MAVTARAWAAGDSFGPAGKRSAAHAVTSGSAAAYVEKSPSIAASYRGPSAGSR